MAQIDPRETEVVEQAPDGRPVGLDLIRLENTRFGLELVGLGLMLLLFATGLGTDAFTPDGRRPSWRALELIVEFCAFGGYLLLALGALVTAATPNGFLPQVLRWAVVGLYVFACGAAVFNAFAPDGGRGIGLWWIGFQERFWFVTRLVPVGLAWILWRFCQHRGLIGRALVWLWIAMAWSVMALFVEFGQQYWIARFYPALGVLAFLAAHLTARDLWTDAVNRKTKSDVAARRQPDPGGESDA